MSQLDFRINKNSPVPLYYQLKQEFYRLLREGQLTPQQRLPSESEMCNLLNVSRSTVRQALTELTNEGLIERRRSTGSFVKDKVSVGTFEGTTVSGISNSIKRHGMTPFIKNISFDLTIAPPIIQELLGINEETKVIGIERLYSADEQPVALSSYFFHPRCKIDLSFEILGNESLYKLLRERCQVFIHKSERNITVSTADQKLSNILGTPAGSPVLLWTGVDFDETGETVGAAISTFYPGIIHIKTTINLTNPNVEVIFQNGDT